MKIVGGIISLLLTFVLLFQVGLNSVIFINFKLNQESIAAAHCINKDKPEMNCDGKCHLKTQLDKTKEVKKPFQSPRYFETELIVFSSESIIVENITTIDKTKLNHFYFSSVSEPHIDVPEVPPQILS